MINIDKQIAYWRDGSQEDWEVAQELVGRGRIRHGLFFADLALEKALKAHVCRHTRDLAPKIHDLVELAELGGVNLPEEYRDVLGKMREFNIEGRYPESLLRAPTVAEARGYMARTKEVFQWLMNLL